MRARRVTRTSATGPPRRLERASRGRLGRRPRKSAEKPNTATFPRSTIRGARRVLRGIDNPLGKIVLLSSFTETMTPRWIEAVYRSRLADARATLLVLALRIWERRHGSLPGSLEEVVEAGLLDSVPADPFGPGALEYSRERRLIWSRGEDGNDNGGREERITEDGEVTEGDSIWRLTESASR